MLNNIGLPGLLLIAIVVLVLFGRGKISSLMGEVGKGITAFKKGVDDGKKEIEDEAASVARDVTPDEEKDKVVSGLRSGFPCSTLGFAELLVIGIVALVFIGPKDLPRGLSDQIGKFTGKDPPNGARVLSGPWKKRRTRPA